MNSTLPSMIIFGVIAFFVLFITYGLLGYAKQVFNANRR